MRTVSLLHVRVERGRLGERARLGEGNRVRDVGLDLRVVGLAPRGREHARALEAARQAGITLHQGVYVCLGGPSFESPADLRFLRAIGADAVGMSTVPEVTVARHGGLRVLGFSGISNAANLDGDTVTTHAEVLEAGHVLVPKLTALVRGVLRRLPT
jgi:purine nucleoside phosphorylase